MITTRSETSSASSWSWVTKTLVTCTSSCSRRSQRRSSFRTLASSAPNGSSSSSTLGFTASARASATRWRWPPESSDGRRLRQHVELHQAQQVHDRLADLRLGRPDRAGPDPQPEGDVLEHAHVPEQRVVLEHEPDLALAHRLIGRVLAVEADRAAVGRLQPGDDAQQRGLARPGRAEQRHQLAARHVEVHVVAARRSRRTPCSGCGPRCSCRDPFRSCRPPRRASAGGAALLPLDQRLERERDEGEQREHATPRRSSRRRRTRCRGSPRAAAACWSRPGCARRRPTPRRTRPSRGRCRG